MYIHTTISISPGRNRDMEPFHAKSAQPPGQHRHQHGLSLAGVRSSQLSARFPLPCTFIPETLGMTVIGSWRVLPLSILLPDWARHFSEVES